MTAATIIVRQKSGVPRTFHAAEAEVRHGVVVATGRWANAPRTTGSYSWPARQVLVLRWEAVPYV